MLPLVIALGLAACSRREMPPTDRSGPPVGSRQNAAAASPQRIVSMAPSITETVFALGCGNRLVGVTDFCRYPPEAESLPKIGGYLNPNWEAVLRLQPDLVIIPAGQEDFATKLDRFHLRSVTVDHRSVDDVFKALEILGRALGVEERARALDEQWRRRLGELEIRCRDKPRPRVLLVIERSREPGRLRDICAAGPDGFLDRLIEVAGGENVLHDAPVPFPMLSSESVLKLNPDVIIDIMGGVITEKVDRQVLLSGWQQVKEVSAVRNQRIYLLGDDVPLVPGPRMIELAETLARCFHSGEMGLAPQAAVRHVP
ncbi:MAG: ABC transporter substrate-binding protein [Thermogutta sp.]